MKFKDKVTLFNRLESEGTVIYNKILINSALWFDGVSSSILKTGIVDLNAKTIYINKNQNFGATYVLPESYERLTSGEGFFTINNGDYIGLGDITLDENETPQRYKNRTGLLYEVVNINNYMMGLNKHFEIIAN